MRKHLPRINFTTVPHKDQRYDTVGDYFESVDILDRKFMFFKVSEMESPDYEFLVLIHELVEWYLISRGGIDIKKIDEFDMKFEELRKKNPEMIGNQEPGDMKSAPYHDAHVFATSIEKMIAHELLIDWDGYDELVDNL